MKVLKVLFAAFLILLASEIAASEPAIDFDMALNQALESVQEDQGVITVRVPLYLLRSSLWYYENYFIQQNRADSLDAMLTRESEISSNRLARVGYLQIELERVTRSRDVWRSIGLAGIIYFAGRTTYDIIGW